MHQKETLKNVLLHNWTHTTLKQGESTRGWKKDATSNKTECKQFGSKYFWTLTRIGKIFSSNTQACLFKNA